jgi:hypothetical protein
MKKLLLAAGLAITTFTAKAAWNVEVSMSSAFATGSVSFIGRSTVGCVPENATGSYTLTTTPTTYNGAAISSTVANIITVGVGIDTLGYGTVDFCSITPGTGKTLNLTTRGTATVYTIHYDVITWTASLVSLYFYP